MASRYEKQIEKLLQHVKRLHGLIEERGQQLKYWQSYANKLREERQRLVSAMVTAIRPIMSDVARRHRAIREENLRLAQYIKNQESLHEKQNLQLKAQLQYALGRIDDLSLERRQWRVGIQQRQQQIWSGQERLDQLERELATRTTRLTGSFESERKRARELEERLAIAEQQIEIQHLQWQDLVRERDDLSKRLESSERALEIAQRTLSDMLTSQQTSMGREVDHLRALVVSLQEQTESLRTEVSRSHETIETQERFIAVLRGEGKPGIRSLTERRRPVEPGPEDQQHSG